MISSRRAEEVLVPTEERSLRQLNEASAGRGAAIVRQFHLLLWSPCCFRNTLGSPKTIPKCFDCPFFAPMAVWAPLRCVLAFALTLFCTTHNQPSASMSLMLVALTAVAGLLLLYFFFQRSSTPKAQLHSFFLINSLRLGSDSP